MPDDDRNTRSYTMNSPGAPTCNKPVQESRGVDAAIAAAERELDSLSQAISLVEESALSLCAATGVDNTEPCESEDDVPSNGAAWDMVKQIERTVQRVQRVASALARAR